MKKLRLLITKACPKQCEGCCNKDWKLDELPICTDYSGYDEILITGGEPMIRNARVKFIIKSIREQNKSVRIYLYSVLPNFHLWRLLHYKLLDGITITLHDQEDVKYFLLFDRNFSLEGTDASLRVNIFKGIKIDTDSLMSNWIVKDDIEWIKDCPLPTDEVFMRTENID